MSDPVTTFPRPAQVQQTDEPVRSAMVLLPLRLFLAAGWLRAGAEKVIDPAWWNGHKLHTFLTAQHHDALPFFRPVMDSAISPFAVQVAAVVAIAQILIGLALLVGRPLRTALWCGVILNVTFVLCGKVNPSAFYLVMEAALLYAVSTGHLGRGARTPSARAFLVIGGWVVVAAAMAPFVRTLEPAKVIEDPAMMLVFLSLVMAGTTFSRWLHQHGPRITALTELSVSPFRTWLCCGSLRGRHAQPVARTEPAPDDHLELAWRQLTEASTS